MKQVPSGFNERKHIRLPFCVYTPWQPKIRERKLHDHSNDLLFSIAGFVSAENVCLLSSNPFHREAAMHEPSEHLSWLLTVRSSFSTYVALAFKLKHARLCFGVLALSKPGLRRTPLSGNYIISLYCLRTNLFSTRY